MASIVQVRQKYSVEMDRDTVCAVRSDEPPKVGINIGRRQLSLFFNFLVGLEDVNFLVKVSRNSFQSFTTRNPERQR